jgi:hypothetical protein
VNVAKVAIVFQLGGDDWEPAVCTFHVMAAASRAPFSEADMALIGERVNQWWREPGPYTPLILGSNSTSAWFTPQVKLQTVEVERIEPAGDKIVVPGENWAGQLFDVDTTVFSLRARPEPPQCCWLISLRTTVEDRRARGRIYLPATRIETDAGPFPQGWSQEDQAVGRIPEGSVDALGGIAQGLAYFIRTATETEGEFVLAVYSRTYGEVHPVTHFEVQRWLRTQRRRAVMPGGWDHFDLVPT